MVNITEIFKKNSPEKLKQIRGTGWETSDKIASFLSTLHYVDGVLLFGSLVYDIPKMGSLDIDLMVWVDRAIMQENFPDLYILGPTNELEKMLGQQGFKVKPGTHLGLDLSVYFTDYIKSLLEASVRDPKLRETVDYFNNIICEGKLLYTKNDQINDLLKQIVAT